MPNDLKLRVLAALNCSPIWFRISSLLLLVLSACLLALALGSAIYASRYVGALIPTLLVCVALSVLVFTLYFRIAWRNQRARDAAWFVGTALDVSARKNAELEANRNLAAAAAAHAETEALRKSTLTLTQNLSMDAVLDNLLACLHDLVPYDNAAVILAEDELRLFIAREAPKRVGERSFVTLETTDSPVLQRVLVGHKNVYVPDTAEESDWREIKPLAGSRSWMGIPLMAANGMFGLLSISASTPSRFTTEHVRLAKSMAAPAAAAIYNVRLYERAEIYASELEVYINKLKEAQKQLEHTRGREAAQS